MTYNTQIDDIYKYLNDFKEIPNFENYLISKFGIIYNKNANKISNKFLKPQLHKNGNYYFTKLNGTQYQIGSFNQPYASATSSISVISAVLYCNGTTDYVELYGYVEGVGTLSFLSTSTWFNGVLVRSA
jgi:hypothetical protein